MKIVKIDEPQTTKRTYPYLAYLNGHHSVLYICFRDGFVCLGPNSNGYKADYIEYQESSFSPVMGAVTLLND